MSAFRHVGISIVATCLTGCLVAEVEAQQTQPDVSALRLEYNLTRWESFASYYLDRPGDRQAFLADIRLIEKAIAQDSLAFRILLDPRPMGAYQGILEGNYSGSKGSLSGVTARGWE